MKLLVTGSQGFVAKNLIATLKQNPDFTVLEYHRDTSYETLDYFVETADFVFHLAGVNRPETEQEFMEGNYRFTSGLLDALARHGNKAPILMTSSIQASLDNAYGQSKLAGEKALIDYAVQYGVQTYIYRLPNIFGKWSKPNYNSVVATFCHNVARGLDIEVRNPESKLELAYIDDVVQEFISCLEDAVMREGYFYTISHTYKTTVGEVADLIYSFRNSRKTLIIPDMAHSFIKKLYSTYLSYLPEDEFSYPLLMHQDERGSFTEFLKNMHGGQVSINVSKPDITKGNHWHHTKNEKFLVVYGEGVIRFRDIFEEKIIEYKVSSERLDVVDIPVGYTHSIVNTGPTDLVTVMWVNEVFDSQNPDTYYMEVDL